MKNTTLEVDMDTYNLPQNPTDCQAYAGIVKDHFTKIGSLGISILELVDFIYNLQNRNYRLLIIGLHNMFNFLFTK